MIRLLPSEKFKEFEVPSHLRKRYAISNHGRLMSFDDNIENGKLLIGSKSDGYRIFKYSLGVAGGKVKSNMQFVYKLVAEHFIPKTSDDQGFVIHLDHTRGNDHYTNLKWVNAEDRMVHYKKSPHVIEGRKKLLEFKKKSDGHKLTITQVIRLKKLLHDPNRKTRMKILARQFGISEMQLYRIKSGENWGHIKI